MLYRCECGREFENPQSFNGHKCHCKVHLSSVGKLDIRIKQEETRFNKVRNT